jgi:outer membrane protein assembly factor BamB
MISKSPSQRRQGPKTALSKTVATKQGGYLIIRFMQMLLLLAALTAADDANWTQFRGPGGSAVAAVSAAPPVEFGPSKKLLWKQTLPSGHSSPVVWGDRIFVSSFDKDAKKFEVLCLAKKTGAILWRREVVAPSIEKVHAISSPVTSTPVVDADRVYAYFPSYGLAAFTHAGEPQWTMSLPVPATRFGTGTSPVLDGELLILCRDTPETPELLAVNRKSGKTAWRTELEKFGESYSTPVVWKGQIVLHRRNVIVSYDLADGKQRWSIAGQTNGTSTVAASGDTIYAGTWSPAGDAEQIGVMPDFATMLKSYDKNGDGALSEEEFPADLKLFYRPDMVEVGGSTMYLKTFLGGILSQSKDHLLHEQQWEMIRGQIKMIPHHGLLAIRLDADGKANVAWREENAIPEVPSPVVYKDRVFLVRNGGIVSCLDAANGKLIYRTRVGAANAYFASPVVAKDNVYVASAEGVVSVFRASGDKLDVLARNDLGEEIYSTPAVSGSMLLVRTSGHLFAFGETRQEQAETKAPAFEIASIKPSDPGARNGCFIRGQPGGQTFVGSCVTLRLLIKYSYKITDSQLAGGPDWLDTEFYDFQAKADHSLTRAELPAVFQALLAERFKLQFHRETRTLPALLLTVDKSGAKMKANDGPDEWAISIVPAGAFSPPAPPKFKGTRCAMSYLTWWIAQRENRPVLDKTGLPGFWDFTLEFVPEGLGDARKGPAGEPIPGFEGPTLYTALREQLGLKLESAKGPIEVYVVDHVEKATAN